MYYPLGLYITEFNFKHEFVPCGLWQVQLLKHSHFGTKRLHKVSIISYHNIVDSESVIIGIADILPRPMYMHL